MATTSGCAVLPGGTMATPPHCVVLLGGTMVTTSGCVVLLATASCAAWAKPIGGATSDGPGRMVAVKVSKEKNSKDKFSKFQVS